MKPPAPETGPRVRLEGYMRQGLAEEIEELARFEDTSISALIREALRDLLAKRAAAKK